MLNRNTRLFAAAIVGLGFVASSHAAVAPGSLMPVAAFADDSEHYAFVALSPIAAGEVLNFTDSSYGSSGAGEADKFRWTEHFAQAAPTGPLTLTVGAGGIAAGKVIVYDDVANAFTVDGVAAGAVSGGESDLSTGGEQLFVYQGTVTDLGGSAAYRGDTTGASFVTAFNWGGTPWLTTGAGSTSSSYLPASLTDASTAFQLPAANLLDNVRYSGPTSFSSLAAARAAVLDSANWTGSDVALALGDITPSFTIVVPEPVSLSLLAGAGLAVLRRRTK